jgi:hypothetical protein
VVSKLKEIIQGWLLNGCTSDKSFCRIIEICIFIILVSAVLIAIGMFAVCMLLDFLGG